MKIILGLIFLWALASEAAPNAVCSWCIRFDKMSTQKALALANLDAATMIKKVRDQGICIKVLESGRKIPPGTFLWTSVEKATGKLSDLTQISSLMGKTLCADEVPLAKSCMTIALASDAMKSTLIHEYLHTEQIKKDKSWCPLSKKTWVEKHLSPSENQIFLNHEWDVYLWLYEHLDALKPTLEEKLSIASSLIEQAKLRSSYDSTAMTYIKERNIQEKIQDWFNEFTKNLQSK